MRFFRLAWVVLAAAILGLDVAGIPYTYARYESVCNLSAEVCAEDSLLTPEGARQLGELGISQDFYAVYQGVGVETALTLICFAVAAVIFFRRSDDRMALFTSFVLIVFGGAGAAGTMRALAEAHPAFWFPVTLMDYASQVCFGIFFYLFPDGRFVPRWTRWAAVVSAAFFVPDIFLPDSTLADLTSPLFFVFLGSLVIAQVYRYRRVSTPEQRQQTKWVVFGFAAALVGFTALIGLSLVPAIREVGPLGQMIFSTVVYGFLSLIPLSIGVAMLRYRLYDIDVVINRTLVYGTLTAIAGAGVRRQRGRTAQYVFRLLAGGGLPACGRRLDPGDSRPVQPAEAAHPGLHRPALLPQASTTRGRPWRTSRPGCATRRTWMCSARTSCPWSRNTMQPEHVSLWLKPAGDRRSR